MTLVGCSTQIFHPNSAFAGIVDAASFNAEADVLRATYGTDTRAIVVELVRRGASCRLDKLQRKTYTCRYSFCSGNFEQVAFWVYGVDAYSDRQKPHQLTHNDGTIISINVPGHGDFCKTLKMAKTLQYGRKMGRV